MAKIAEYEAVARRAIQASKSSPDREDAAKYAKVAQQAIDAIKRIKAEEGNLVEPSQAATQQPQPQAPVAPRMAPQASTAPSVTPRIQEILDGPSPRMNRQAPQGGGQSPQGGQAPRMDQGQGLMGGDLLAQTAKENMSVTGALTGAATGAMVGGVPGAIIGGAVGTFGGEAAEDYFEGVPIDWENAFKASAFSVGIDLATLGTAKVLGPFIKKAIQSGKSPEEAVEELAKRSKSPDVGTPESLAQVQQTLERGGTTLSPAEIGSPNTGGLNFLDALTREAMAGKSVTNARRDAMNQVVKSEYDRLFGAGGLGKDMNSNEIANNLAIIISKGKAGLAHNYNIGLDEVKKLLTNETVNTGAIKRRLVDIVKKGKITNTATELDEGTLKILDEMITAMPPSMKATDLLRLEKKFMNRIREVGTFGSTNYNSIASSELAKVSSTYRKSILGLLSQANPKAAKLYSEVKSNYGRGIENITPEINKNFIEQAGKGNYEALGRLFTNVNNIDQIQALMKSVRTSYRQMGKEADNLVFSNADEAVRVMRESYVNQIFKGFDGENGIAELANLAKMYQKPNKAKQLEAVLGSEGASQVKRYMNLISTVAREPASPAGTLVLRSKEAQAAGAVGSFMLGGTGGLGLAAGVFASPWIIQKVISKPGLANKIIATTKNPKITSPEKMAVALNDLLYNYEIFEEDISKRGTGMSFEDLK